VTTAIRGPKVERMDIAMAHRDIPNIDIRIDTNNDWTAEVRDLVDALKRPDRDVIVRKFFEDRVGGRRAADETINFLANLALAAAQYAAGVLSDRSATWVVCPECAKAKK
jgi:hypothetical protein